MQPVTVISGPVAALDRANVDTDQIIPKQFLKRIERTGFGEFLFWDWRQGPRLPAQPARVPGRPDPGGGTQLRLRQLPRARALGTSGSRLRGDRRPRFSDIFTSNCTKIGLLPVEIAEDAVRELLDSAPAPATIDLQEQTVTLPGGRVERFSIDPDARERLLNGWDEIALTENRRDEIEAYEAARERSGPNTLTL